MEKNVYDNVKVLWDYMHMNQPLQKADCIVGFGCYNEEIALRAAELYHQGWAPLVLFTGGLGRNTKDMWTEPEARRFAKIAMAAGVPEEKILIEDRSTNTAENILFTKKILEPLGVKSILGIHKPFMERRLYAALGAYWPEMPCTVTSPQETIEEYMALSVKAGMEEKRVIEVLVGDFQRIEVYAEKGWQTPQVITPQARAAFRNLVDLGFTRELIR